MIKALCPEIGSVPIHNERWLPWFNETTIRYSSTPKEAKAMCDKKRCPVKSCTRKILISADASDFSTILARRVHTDILKEEQDAEKKRLLLEQEVYELMKRDGLL